MANTTSQQIEYSPAAVQTVADEATRAALEFVAMNRVEVVDFDTLSRAVEIRTAIAERQKSIASKLQNPKSWAHSLHRWFCDLETKALAPYSKLDDFERQQISNFKAEQDRIRAEQERIAADARKREMEIQAASEAAALESQGDHELAQAVLEESIQAPAPVVVLPDQTKSVDGLSFVRRYKWRYGPGGMSRALALLPREYLTVDEKKLTGIATTMKGDVTLPGVEFYHVDDPVRR